ncbi:MAG: GNAT family N-acetyltransferase [Ruminococcaceae bacterium]|nr:GNAT family N-acetyltransferase [Oscillospiraceae bacterium]
METKIATENDLIKLYAEKMKENPSDAYLARNLNKRLDSMKKGTRIFFIGTENDKYICEMAACVSPDDEYTQNIAHITDFETFYLFSFLTKPEYRGQGYFSLLFRYAQKILTDMGAKYLTLGVEPDDYENKARYKKWGFGELIYTGTEEFDGMKIKVEYYRKTIKGDVN